MKSRSHCDIAHFNPSTNVPTKYQLPTRYCFRDIAQTGFNRSRSLRQGQRTNQDYSPLTNVPTKCQLPTPYGFQDIVQTRFLNSRSQQQGQGSNQGHTI